jgi:hypothetical protein
LHELACVERLTLVRVNLGTGRGEQLVDELF